MLLQRPRYRILEKRAVWDEEEEAKILKRLDADPPVFTPNYDHLIEIIVFRILKTWLLRGMYKPVTLLALDVTTGEHKNEPLKGLNHVCIKRFKGEKMVKLSFEKTSVRESTNTYMLQEKMKEYCVVSLIMFYIENTY